MLAPLCLCKPPRYCISKVSHSEANPNRLYWVCEKAICGQHVWDNVPRAAYSLPGPPCKCGHPSLHKVTYKYTPPRSYWTCASSSLTRCNYFQWEDGVGPSETERAAVADARSACSKCGEPVVILVTKQGNAKGNGGRKYVKCSTWVITNS